MRAFITILVGVILAGSVFGGHIQRPDAARAQFFDTSPMARSNNIFAFRLYQQLGEDSDNLIFSPFSITQALGMLYAGAQDTTQQQIAETLALPAEEEINFSELTQAMYTPPDSEDVLFQLNIANSLWAQQEYPFQPDYISFLNEFYGTYLQEVDFSTPDETAQIINSWVSEQTQGNIENLVNPSTLDMMTRLMLINAIYLNAGWSELFDESLTQDDAFTLLDGSQVTVPMMHMRQQFRYVGTETFLAAELEYQHRNFSMMIILPDPGQFAAVKAMLNNEFFEMLRTQLFDYYNLELSLPRFSYDTNLQLAGVLAEMGMPIVFSGEADFSGISAEPLFVTQVVHKTFISVDEKGTEAAAVTEIRLGGGGPPNMPLVFNVNRPFIYIIYESTSGAILFMGQVLDPRQ